MGEIADSLINGEFDCVTGEYIGEPCGFPRTFEKDHDSYIGKRYTKIDKFNEQFEQRGGRNLIGKYADVVFTLYKDVKSVDSIERCLVVGYGGKRGKKHYVVRLQDGSQKHTKFSKMSNYSKEQ